MSIREAATVIVATVVAFAAILGGAFYPGPRVVVGALMAVCTRLGGRVCGGEARHRRNGWLLDSSGGESCGRSGGLPTPLAAREVVTVWVVTWGLWLVARRAGE